MAQQRQVRRAAGKIADQYVDGEDPHGTKAEQLSADEDSGALAFIHYELEITDTHGDDLSDDVAEPVRNALAGVEDALEARADEVLGGAE